MRLSVLLIALLPACWSSPPPGFTVSPGLDIPGGATVLDLRRLPASWTLPEQDDATPTPTRFVLTGATPARGRLAQRMKANWEVSLPFRPPEGSDRFPPPGMKVRIGDRDLPWLFRSRQEGGWRIGEEGQLILSVPSPPAEVIVEHPGLARTRDRTHPIRSGLSPSAFSAYSMSLGLETREGLILPAGMSGSWDERLPPGARFQAEVGRIEDALGEDRAAPGLALRIETEDGAVTTVSEVQIEDAGRFQAWEVDLSAWGGERVQLSLVGQGAGDDSAFVAHPVVVGTPEASAPLPRRLVWIGLDTTRPDRLGLYGYPRPTSPHLDAWARSAVVYEDACTPAPRTRPSFRTALTGRRPLDAVGQPTVLQHLDEAGFATAGIVANVHLNPRFGFPDGADSWSLDPNAKAKDQVADAIDWLDHHADRDAALFLHIMDPHLAYIPPREQEARFVREPTNLPPRFSRTDVYKWMKEGLDDARKAHISDLYDAEIASTDAALGRLFEHLEQLPGRTLVVIHSDHGEELWDHGAFEHNHSLKPELHDAVMILRAPGLAPRREAGPVALMDLAPTVLSLLGVPVEGLDGTSVAETAPQTRPRDLGHLMYDRERWGVRAGAFTYVLHTASGREEAFDTRVDPTESDDIWPDLGEAQRAELIAALGQAHGMEVGPGWRIDLDLDEELIALDLPAPAERAGVLDPERARKHRANLSWGEQAPVLPDDVATLRLSEDRRRILVVPGRVGKGQIWVRFASPTPVSGLLRAGGEQLELAEGEVLSTAGVRRLKAWSGTVAVPPPGEAARIRALSGEAPVGLAESAILKRLGYLKDTDAP